MWTIATFDKYNPEILIYLILQSDLLVYDPTSSLKHGSYCLSPTHNSAKLIAAGDFLYPFFIPSFLLRIEFTYDLLATYSSPWSHKFWREILPRRTKFCLLFDLHIILRSWEKCDEHFLISRGQRKLYHFVNSLFIRRTNFNFSPYTYIYAPTHRFSVFLFTERGGL